MIASSERASECIARFSRNIPANGNVERGFLLREPKTIILKVVRFRADLAQLEHSVPRSGNSEIF